MFTARRPWSHGSSRSIGLGTLTAISGCCFFFQAEDGIRDLTVTGVQTCALPILVRLQGLGEGHRGGQVEAVAHVDPDVQVVAYSLADVLHFFGRVVDGFKAGGDRKSVV